MYVENNCRTKRDGEKENKQPFSFVGVCLCFGNILTLNEFLNAFYDIVCWVYHVLINFQWKFSSLSPLMQWIFGMDGISRKTWLLRYSKQPFKTFNQSTYWALETRELFYSFSKSSLKEIFVIDAIDWHRGKSWKISILGSKFFTLSTICCVLFLFQCLTNSHGSLSTEILWACITCNLLTPVIPLSCCQLTCNTVLQMDLHQMWSHYP